LYSRPQKFIAEFLGTFVIVFVTCAVICSDVYIRTGNPTGLGWLGIALAQGLAYAAMIMTFAHISGARLNPAVTIGFWVTRRITTFETLAEWGAQLFGAAAAGYFVRYLVPEDIWRAASLGTPQLSHDITPAAAMLIEGVLTAIVVLVAFATSADSRAAENKSGAIGVGFAIAMCVMVGGPFTGAALNPARAFGPALASKHWAAHGVYWAGPLAGGVIASWLYDTLYLKKE
jgi:MIP family channel proteins